MNPTSAADQAGTVDKLAGLADKTSSDIVIFVIIVAIVVVIIGLPLYRMASKSAERKLELWAGREKAILEVIDRNSNTQSRVAEVVSSLKAVLEGNQMQCRTCQNLQMARFQTLQDGQHEISTVLNRLETVVVERVGKEA